MRHGVPIGGRRYRGQTDDPLSPEGWREMRAAVGDYRSWHAIVSSPLLRCAEFARDLAARLGLPVVFEPRLMERGYGAWEGRRHEDVRAHDPHALARFCDDPFTHSPAGSEPLPAFRARVLAAWEELIFRYRGQHLLVVGHAGVVRVLISHVLEVPLRRLFRIDVPSACLSRVQIEHSAIADLPRLLFHAGCL